MQRVADSHAWRFGDERLSTWRAIGARAPFADRMVLGSVMSQCGIRGRLDDCLERPCDAATVEFAWLRLTDQMARVTQRLIVPRHDGERACPSISWKGVVAVAREHALEARQRLTHERVARCLIEQEIERASQTLLRRRARQ
eukprot:1330295-Prymnesium_polylepis.2